ncbi:MAG TPA: hypothetical protein ENN80_02735 [Candidatus Hydrogenedentes bacterium]|nr:hypothetical protein [Candidatus Hydrogenedentota bacterium]
MAEQAEQYGRALSRGRKHLGLSPYNTYRLYLGSDHVLHVAASGYSERSKRFYFKDIQAMVITKTRSALWIGVVLGALLLTAVLVIWD